jgi:3-phosphoshikimate 1-carboxyvinyltransferase
MSAAPPSPSCFGAAPPLRGKIRVPGDKAISRLALMLSALSVGESRIQGLLEDADVLATAAALRALGADVTRGADGHWCIRGVGVGGLLQPQAALDMGGSRTSACLLMGLLASHPVTAAFTGDATISARSMRDVIEPLSRMGAEFTASPGDRLPLMLRGACPAVPIEYRPEIPSADVKSAVLLAGLNAPGTTRVIERLATRDHIERMLRGFGADITIEHVDGERIVSIRGEADLRPQQIVVPGDPSSAAFAVVAALIVPGSAVTIENVGLNPTRAGLFEILRAMGGDIRFNDKREVAGEPVANVEVRYSSLHGIAVPAELASGMIDELPILSVAAAFAEGRTVIRGLAELRGRDDDRLSVMAGGLRATGTRVEKREDRLTIEGSAGEPLPGGATISARVPVARRPIAIDDMAAVAAFPPGLSEMIAALSGHQRQDQAA